MSQDATRPCISCGTPLPVNQRYCSNCGALQDIHASSETVRRNENLPEQSAPSSEQNLIPPPPPTYQENAPSTSYESYQQEYPQSYSGPQQNYPQAYQQVPAYAQAQQNNNAGLVGGLLGLLLLRSAGRSVRHRFMGCFLWIIIIVAFVICGLVARSVYSNAQSTTTTNTTYTNTQQNNQSTNGTPVSSIQKSTIPVNAAITYSGINMTIVDAQQAPSFTDDTNNQSPGILRLDLKEQTGPINNVFINYNNVFQLVAPDGTTINASAAQNNSAPGQSVSRTNWLDFPISKNIQANQYTLRIGAATEAQMDVPLTGKADLSKYQPRKATPNTHITYGGVNFTITDATSELSYNGPQAKKGMVYIVVDVTVDNNSSHTFYGPLTDVRLKTGATSTPPASSFDVVNAGQTNVQKTLVFEMPQGSTNFTLVFLPSTDNNAPTQVTGDFTIS